MKIHSRLVLIVCFLIVMPICPVVAGPAAPSESKDQRAARMKWWQDARFGLFVHWGPVTLTGKELSWARDPGPNGYRGDLTTTPAAEYDSLFKKFNPVKFDARRWVAMAKAAGMKYLVFTSKHHDGFCEFDSKLTDYKITNLESPFHRDVVKELADACHAAGMRFGLYYSPPDCHHPDYRTARHARYIQYLHGQVRELLSNYGRIDVMWFDGLGGSTKDWDTPGLYALIKRLQPAIIINDRCGLRGDFTTPEQIVGNFDMARPWESCMTIGTQWSWKPDDKVKSAKDCLRVLVNCAGGDGNLLLNIGPMASGEFEPRQVEPLRQMGRWLEKYGCSIYGTRGGPYKPGRDIASTRSGNMVYVHVLQWQGDRIVMPALPKKVLCASLLTSGEVKLAESAGRLAFTVPKADQRDIDTVIALRLAGPAEEIPPIDIGK